MPDSHRQTHEIYNDSIGTLEVQRMTEAVASAKAYMDSLHLHLRAVDEALSEVELLAPSAVIAAASEFVKVGKLWSDDRRDAYDAAKQEFIRLARADLGITYVP